MSVSVASNQRPMRFGEECTELIGLFRPELDLALSVLWDHPQLNEVIANYFVQLHAAVRGILHAMQVALETARLRKHEDAAAAGLVAYLERHLEEERGHDEWLLEDMKHLGLDRHEILAQLPSPTVASIIGAQYFWIHHCHPVAVLGYIAAVEMRPPSAKRLAEIVESTKLPREAFRTLFEHAEIDPQHGLDLRRCLDELALADRHRAVIRTNICRTMHLLTQHYSELVALVEPRGRVRTARRARA